MWKELVPEQNSGVQFSVYVAHPDEISVAKFRLTSALGRPSRPGWAAQLRVGLRPVDRRHWGDRAPGGDRARKKTLLSPGPGDVRSEPAAAYAAEGAGRSISLPLKLDESETAPGGVCASLFWGLLQRVGRGRVADSPCCCWKVKDVGGLCFAGLH